MITDPKKLDDVVSKYHDLYASLSPKSSIPYDLQNQIYDIASKWLETYSNAPWNTSNTALKQRKWTDREQENWNTDIEKLVALVKKAAATPGITSKKYIPKPEDKDAFFIPGLVPAEWKPEPPPPPPPPPPPAPVVTAKPFPWGWTIGGLLIGTLVLMGKSAPAATVAVAGFEGKKAKTRIDFDRRRAEAIRHDALRRIKLLKAQLKAAKG